MAGYSGTPLPKKLGIKPGHRVVALRAPAEFVDTLGELPPEAKLLKRISSNARYDVIIVFCKDAKALHELLPTAMERIDVDGGIWFAWPKKASGIVTDVTENLVRESALEAGLVDNKICAIDATWSGLRCVYRVKDRDRVRAARADS